MAAVCISIHALLAESDAAVCKAVSAELYFYPRSPCGERLKTPCVKLSIDVFLSTLSLRRATDDRQERARQAAISIHALLAESDHSLHRLSGSSSSFLSTLSLRRATRGRFLPKWGHRDFYPRSPCGERLCDNTYTLGITDISIHALLAESDHHLIFPHNRI